MKVVILILSLLVTNPAFSCMTIYCEARCLISESKVDKMVYGEADKVSDAFEKLKEKCQNGQLMYQTKSGLLTKTPVDSATPSDVCKKIEPSAATNSAQSSSGAK